MTYPHSPGFKEDVTSRAAAEKVAPKAKKIRERVLETLQYTTRESMSAEDIAMQLDLTIYQVRPRLTELFNQGRIQKWIPKDGSMGCSVWTWRVKRP